MEFVLEDHFSKVLRLSPLGIFEPRDPVACEDGSLTHMSPNVPFFWREMDFLNGNRYLKRYLEWMVRGRKVPRYLINIQELAENNKVSFVRKLGPSFRVLFEKHMDKTCGTSIVPLTYDKDLTKMDPPYGGQQYKDLIDFVIKVPESLNF